MTRWAHDFPVESFRPALLGRTIVRVDQLVDEGFRLTLDSGVAVSIVFSSGYGEIEIEPVAEPKQAP